MIITVLFSNYCYLIASRDTISMFVSVRLMIMSYKMVWLLLSFFFHDLLFILLFLQIYKALSNVQYSQRRTFIWTSVTAIYVNVFTENDHRDGCFLPMFRVVTGVQLPTAVNTALCGVRTPRIPMARHGGPLFYTIYMYNVDDEKQLTAMIPRGRPPRILAFRHRDTRGSWPPGSTGVRPRCSTARG